MTGSGKPKSPARERLEFVLLNLGGGIVSDNILASWFRLSPLTIRQTRRELESVSAIPATTMRICKDSRVRDTSRIGRRNPIA
jgi:hypothetical protein